MCSLFKARPSALPATGPMLNPLHLQLKSSLEDGDMRDAQTLESHSRFVWKSALDAAVFLGRIRQLHRFVRIVCALHAERVC